MLLQELLKKCHQCMETIVKAKDQQAAEANKNASILLKELDLEKVMSDPTAMLWEVIALSIHWMRSNMFCYMTLCCVRQSREESKKQALAAKREKRKEKRKKKKEEQKRKQEEEEGQKTKEEFSEMQEQKEDSAEGNFLGLLLQAARLQNFLILKVILY